MFKVNFFVFLILLFFNINLQSQDTIFKLDGDVIIAKIVDSTATVIKYSFMDVPNSAVYLLQKSSIIDIHYASGKMDKFNINPSLLDDYVISPKFDNTIKFGGKGYFYKGRNCDESEVLSILLKTGDNEILQLIKKANKLKRAQYWGFIGVFFVIVAYEALIIVSESFGEDEEVTRSAASVSAIFAVAAISSPMIPISLKIKRRTLVDEAICIFNKKN